MNVFNYRCKITFKIIFIKKRVFNVFFYFFKCFLFSSGNFFYPTKLAKILINLQNSCIKRLLSYGFNMAAIKNSLMKSRVALKRCNAC